MDPLHPCQYQIHATSLPLARLWLSPLYTDVIYCWFLWQRVVGEGLRPGPHVQRHEEVEALEAVVKVLISRRHCEGSIIYNAKIMLKWGSNVPPMTSMGWRFSSNVIRESWASVRGPWLWRDSGGPRMLRAANISVSFKIL